MDDHARHLHALCGAGGPHCDCCNDTSPRGGKKTRRRRQRARKVAIGYARLTAETVGGWLGETAEAARAA